VFLVPGLFAAAIRTYNPDDVYSPPAAGTPWWRLALGAGAATGALYALYPALRGVAEKMVTH